MCVLVFLKPCCFDEVQDQGKSSLWWNGLHPGSMTVRVWNRWSIQALKEHFPPEISRIMPTLSPSAFRYNHILYTVCTWHQIEGVILLQLLAYSLMRRKTFSPMKTILTLCLYVTETGTACEGIPTSDGRSRRITEMSVGEDQQGEKRWRRWYWTWSLWEIIPFNQHPLRRFTYSEPFVHMILYIAKSARHLA